MLQRICDRCGKIIQHGLDLKIDVKNGELPSDMCLVHLDNGPFRTGVQSDGNIKRRVINASDTKRYELCKDCKDELISWLTKYEKLEDNNINA